MKSSDFLIIGAGIFGLCTAIELRKKNHTISILNADKIPDPLAASTDISKIIRMEYGSDVEYMEMAIASMKIWREWNDFSGETLYHETGFLLTTSNNLDHASQKFEKSCFDNLQKKEFSPERIDNELLIEKFPAFKNRCFADGFYHKNAGFVESGRTLEVLANYAKSLGVQIFENEKATQIITKNRQVKAVKTTSKNTFSANQIIVCAGNFTPYLLPELKPFMKITGHPVFHLKPSQPELFTYPNFTVFAADISNTGWYGFPIHPKEKVVKIARHSEGLILNPEIDERTVTQNDELELRNFLKATLPSLANDPIVYTRRCCYTDTLDGHFWIDNHPEVENLTIGSGGSGHGFKMGPVVGKMIAAVAESNDHQWSDRYKWRTLKAETVQSEEARFLKERKL